ncbi:MAG: PRC-barrel domain-containing protein [Clostridia bacterium]|nr:PRC-barrel domain-containing protein [Clostridia bacterium]
MLEFDISSIRNNPIGKSVYDTKGVSLGKVVDVQAAGKNVKKIITNKCEIPQSFIKKSGADFIIFGLSKNNKKRKNNLSILKNQEKTHKIQENLPKLSIFSQNNLNNQIVGENQMRIFANENSLLGKIITNDLFGMNNEIIARKNETINKKIITTAKNHNKLNILSYFSK